MARYVNEVALVRQSVDELYEAWTGRTKKFSGYLVKKDGESILYHEFREPDAVTFEATLATKWAGRAGLTYTEYSSLTLI